MNDGFAVEVIEVRKNPRFEIGLGRNADAAEQGPRQLGEEAFYEIEPGAVFRREHEGEAALALGREPCLGLLGNMSRVIIEYQLDCAVSVG